MLRGVSKRGRDWVESREPGSPTAVAIGVWKRYQAVDGPLQSALLSLYVLVAILPAVLVIEEYLDSNPGALADRLIRHYSLNSATASLIRDVLVDTRTHELGSALLA